MGKHLTKDTINGIVMDIRLMRIEDLLGKLLVCWGGADGSKV